MKILGNKLIVKSIWVNVALLFFKVMNFLNIHIYM
ncbi:Putative protein [Zobellia galactanivorans]|uniref:Uncharacterized protein n=1 Tax=Zobellia galactanivorans (strain DSM 12802 / CCUG 47099 / CIP 106680 / NCIMB 13871 / Dsij) TaxID=63186 RepID=G0L8M3_ZOBGA|nr:Putative protein [Zobellia galactanivorans]